jgi:hypothetical protein
MPSRRGREISREGGPLIDVIMSRLISHVVADRTAHAAFHHSSTSKEDVAQED